MDMIICPDCKMRVIPKADGTCPSCGARLKGRAKARPKEENHENPEGRIQKQGGSMNYGEILGKAWKIFWRFKALWLVGIAPYLFYSLLFLFSLFRTPGINPLLSTDFYNLPGQEWLAYLSMFVTLIFMVGYLGLSVFTGAATSTGVYQAEQGISQLPLANLLKSSAKYYWRIFGLYGIFFAAIVVLYLIIFGCFFLTIVLSMGFATLCFFPLFFLLIPVFLVGYALYEQAKAAIIVEDLGVIDGLKRGWNILRAHFWHIILMGLILYAGLYVFSMIIAMPLYLVMFAPMFSAMVSNNYQTMETSLSTMSIGMAIVMPLYMVVMGLLYTYVRTAWTLTFLRLTKPSVPPEPAPVENA
jgi:hypothetical protein